MLNNMERLISKLFRRNVGPAPAGVLSLRSFVQVVFEMGSDCHLRGQDGSKHSQRWHDLESICQLLNGSLLDQNMTHHCWDESTKQPCCKSPQEALEKVTVATLNARMGQADPVPSESRWTHLLGNLRATLLRTVPFEVGLRCFEFNMTGPQGENLVDVDSEAAGGGVGEAANRVHARRVLDHYGDPIEHAQVSSARGRVGHLRQNALVLVHGGPNARCDRLPRHLEANLGQGHLHHRRLPATIVPPPGDLGSGRHIPRPLVGARGCASACGGPRLHALGAKSNSSLGTPCRWTKRPRIKRGTSRGPFWAQTRSRWMFTLQACANSSPQRTPSWASGAKSCCARTLDRTHSAPTLWRRCTPS